MRIINLTPHTINIVTEDGGARFDIMPSGTVARCEQQQVLMGVVNDIPVYQSLFGAVQDLPDMREDTLYITSSLVANALKDSRKDLVVPCSYVRDGGGRIIGCQGLARV